MSQKYFPVIYRANKFHCPHCGVFAAQQWSQTSISEPSEFGPDIRDISGLQIALCVQCDNISIWYNEIMIYPRFISVEEANEDLPKDIINDYDEAALILENSPRGAAALLRLAIQKLCLTLGEKGKKIDDDIASLVKKGLSVKIQQALDIVRVIGNGAVHPGTIDLKDDAETASKLFGLINLIADAMISQPRHVDEMYKNLPPEKLKGIADRDGKP